MCAVAARGISCRAVTTPLVRGDLERAVPGGERLPRGGAMAGDVGLRCADHADALLQLEVETVEARCAAIRPVGTEWDSLPDADLPWPSMGVRTWTLLN